jgi:hypothetical protein
VALGSDFRAKYEAHQKILLMGSNKILPSEAQVEQPGPPRAEGSFFLMALGH